MQSSRRRSEHCFTLKSDPVSHTSLNEASCVLNSWGPETLGSDTIHVKLKEMFIGWIITRGKCTMSHQHLLSFYRKLQTLKQQNTFRTAVPVAGRPDTDVQVRVRQTRWIKTLKRWLLLHRNFKSFLNGAFKDTHSLQPDIRILMSSECWCDSWKHRNLIRLVL